MCANLNWLVVTSRNKMLRILATSRLSRNNSHDWLTMSARVVCLCQGGGLAGKFSLKKFVFFFFNSRLCLPGLFHFPRTACDSRFQKACLHNSQANVLQKVNQPFMNGHLVSLTLVNLPHSPWKRAHLVEFRQYSTISLKSRKAALHPYVISVKLAVQRWKIQLE